jgi:hypothetical protein
MLCLSSLQKLSGDVMTNLLLSICSSSYDMCSIKKTIKHIKKREKKNARKKKKKKKKKKKPLMLSPKPQNFHVGLFPSSTPLYYKKSAAAAILDPVEIHTHRYSHINNVVIATIISLLGTTK